MSDVWHSMSMNMNMLLGGYVSSVLIAMTILIVGWIVALIIAAIARGIVSRLDLSRRLTGWGIDSDKSQQRKIESSIGKGVFYFVMLFVLIAFFQSLGLTQVSEPLNRFMEQVFSYIPQLVGAALLLLVAWVMASIMRFVVARGLTLARLDERLESVSGEKIDEKVSLVKTISNTVYWLVFLLFLPAVLSALQLGGLMIPLQNMIDKLLVFLPNIFAALLILAIGWFVARVVQRIVVNLLISVGVDRISEQVKLDSVIGSRKLSDLLGIIVYVLILIPVIIASLNALNLYAITQPASNMLNAILAALPAIFSAVLLLAIAYVAGRIVSAIVVQLLTAAGFNKVLERIGFKQTVQTTTPAQVVGYLILVAIMLFAAIEASRLLHFDILASLIAQFTVFMWQVVLGVIIMGAGFYFANLAYNLIRQSSAVQANFLALAAKTAILVLAAAMALKQIGIAGEVISLAFGLLLGAIAIALALAFGLGCRDIAAREVESWLKSSKENTQEATEEQK